MAAPRRDMRDVELLDDHTDAGGTPSVPGDVPGAAAVGSGGDGPGPARLPDRTRRARRRGVAVLGLAALLVLAGAAAGERRETRRLADLAAVPGVLEPLTGPVSVLWRRPDAPVGELRQVGDRLVGAVRRPGGTVDVVAVEARTGTDLWRTPVGLGDAAQRWTRCAVPGAGGAAPAPDAPDATDDTAATDATDSSGADPAGDAVVVCVVVDETATTEQSALGSRTYPVAARLVVVDVAGGSVLRNVPTAPTGVLAAVDDDVVLAEVDERGHARATRLDPRTGAARWSSTSTGAVPTDQFRQRSVRVEAAGGLVALDAGPVRVLSASDGSVVDGWQPVPTLDTGGQVQVLAGGTLLGRPSSDDGGWGTELVDVASGRRATAPGYPVPVHPDDRSLPGLVLMLSVEGRRLQAVDAVTGDVRWSAPAGSGGLPLVLDGRVVRAEGRTLRARDGRTGEVVWEAPLPAATRSPLVSDGRLVLVSLPGAGGTGVLTAFGLDDGRSPWSVDLDHEVVLTTAGGRLLGWSGSELVALDSRVNLR